MKKNVLILLAVMLLGVPKTFAYDFSAVAPSGQTLYYSINDDGTSVSVVSPYNGGYGYLTEPTGALTIPSIVSNGGSTYNVTAIGSRAFNDCSGLTSVTIPNSVTNIGRGAFGECSGLTSLTIPNSVTSIGPAVFSYCSGLTSVTIPNSVTSIGEYAFSYCSGLTSVTIPNSVTSIGESVFEGCSGLTSVTIPNSVTSIGEKAFYGCSSLTSVTIPNSVTSIGASAFKSCSGLTSLTIPNSVTSIGWNAFESCSGLTSVTIPNSVTSIGASAFKSCSGLTTVNFNADSCTYIGSNGFPVFESCTNLATVNIGNNVRIIPDYVFGGCSGLTSLTIPNSVTTIGRYAFNLCDHLTNLRFGSGLQSIGGGAFKGCTQVVRIKSFATTAPTIDSTTFKNLSDDVILNVPCGYASAYENAAYWHRFDIQDELMYEFSVAPNDPSRGTVQILNAPSCDNYEAQIQANAYHNYHFARWSDGNTDNPRYIVVMQDVNLEAIFLAEGETEGIDDVEEGALRVWANNGHIYVATDNTAGAETSVEVYDMKGCKVATMATDEESPLFPKGVYLVKVGTLAAKKVVVF